MFVSVSRDGRFSVRMIKSSRGPAENGRPLGSAHVIGHRDGLFSKGTETAS